MLAPPHLRYVGVGWIYCTRRLLTHRRAGGEIAVSCFLEGSCVQNAAMAAGAITRSRGWLYSPYKYELGRMDATLKVVTQLPLTELRRDDGFTTTSRPSVPMIGETPAFPLLE